MEYCGGGSVADLMNVTEEPLDENQIAYTCREALKVYYHGIVSIERFLCKFWVYVSNLKAIDPPLKFSNYAIICVFPQGSKGCNCKEKLSFNLENPFTFVSAV